MKLINSIKHTFIIQGSVGAGRWGDGDHEGLTHKERKALGKIWKSFKRIAKEIRKPLFDLGTTPHLWEMKKDVRKRVPIVREAPKMDVVEVKREHQHNLSFLVPETRKPAKEIGKVMTIAEMMEIARSLK